MDFIPFDLPCAYVAPICIFFQSTWQLHIFNILYLDVYQLGAVLWLLPHGEMKCLHSLSTLRKKKNNPWGFSTPRTNLGNNMQTRCPPALHLISYLTTRYQDNTDRQYCYYFIIFASHWCFFCWFFSFLAVHILNLSWGFCALFWVLLQWSLYNVSVHLSALCNPSGEVWSSRSSGHIHLHPPQALQIVGWWWGDGEKDWEILNEGLLLLGDFSFLIVWPVVWEITIRKNRKLKG